MMSEYLRAKIDRSCNPSATRAQSLNVADQCHNRARRSLWSLMVFLLISICAYSCREFNLFEASSEPVRQLLGYPPPAFMVSIALETSRLPQRLLPLLQLLRRHRRPVYPGPAGRPLPLRSRPDPHLATQQQSPAAGKRPARLKQSCAAETETGCPEGQPVSVVLQ